MEFRCAEGHAQMKAAWRVRALLCEISQRNEFLKLSDIQPPGADIHDVLEIAREAGLVRVGTWWSYGETTHEWLTFWLHGVVSGPLSRRLAQIA